MKERVWRIIESILWLIISITQVTVHTTYMIKNGGIDWHIIFVIIFAVLFGCWLILLIQYILDDKNWGE